MHSGCLEETCPSGSKVRVCVRVGANGQEMEMGEPVAMATGIQWPTAHVCARMNSTRQTWQAPGYQARDSVAQGRGCTPSLSLPHLQPQSHLL